MHGFYSNTKSFILLAGDVSDGKSGIAKGKSLQTRQSNGDNEARCSTQKQTQNNLLVFRAILRRWRSLFLLSAVVSQSGVAFPLLFSLAAKPKNHISLMRGGDGMTMLNLAQV